MAIILQHHIKYQVQDHIYQRSSCYTLDQGSQQWLAAVQNHLRVSSCTRSSNPSPACRPQSPSTVNRKLTTVQPSSPLQLLNSPLKVPPSWKGPTLPKSTTLHSLEVATRFPLKYSFSKNPIHIVTSHPSRATRATLELSLATPPIFPTWETSSHHQ